LNTWPVAYSAIKREHLFSINFGAFICNFDLLDDDDMTENGFGVCVQAVNRSKGVHFIAKD